MNARRLNSYREQLLALTRQLRHDALAVDEELRMPTGGQASGGTSNTPLHLGDLGTDLFHQELNGTLLENEQYLLNEALAALARIDAGTFGRCEKCQIEIAKERLSALPYARMCRTCSERSNDGPLPNLNVGRGA